MSEPRILDIEASLLESRVLFLMGGIKEETANDIVSSLLVLNAIGSDPIDLFINSPGGVVDDGLAIYDVMKTIKAPVHTVCIGNCSSMAAILLSAGDERFAYKNSSIMIHQIAGGVSGKTDEIEVYSKQTEKTNLKLAKILAANTGQTLKKVLKDIKVDKYMTAAEAVSYGLVDSIIKSAKK